MVILSVPPLLRGEDLGDDLVVPPLLVCFFCHLPRGFLLLGVVVEDPRAVLGPPVGALLVGRGGVVHPVEEGEEVGVGDFGGVVD